MVLNITVCIIAISIILLAFSIEAKASKAEIIKIKEEIKVLNNNAKEHYQLRSTVYKLKNELNQLYKYKVIYKDKGLFGSRNIEEKYFFDEKSAKEFMEKPNIHEEVLIELDEEKENVRTSQST
ncbi:hypothetical protein [Lactococcus lactis]|uniref:hypothetical protein n=1 Tax=Lactococcus lactis TaxID=1358 RepID=UPI000513A03E|nr:hypothetical protein [Lactococcus lactis]KGF76743.1 hypothetical protein Llab_1257 [Lactococcus lactis]